MAVSSKPKKEKIIEPFFNDLISVYFDFCREKFNETPSFDGSSPRDFKAIIISLHKRASDSNIEWTFETAKERLYKFLSFCYQDSFIKNNFLLHVINRQKDKIFFNIRAKINQSNNG